MSDRREELRPGLRALPEHQLRQIRRAPFYVLGVFAVALAAGSALAHFVLPELAALFG